MKEYHRHVFKSKQQGCIAIRVLQVQREAIQAVEQDGIVFIDEIDKIVVNQDLRYGDVQPPPSP